MMTPAFLGFTFSGILFALFAFTFRQNFARHIPKVQQFSNAFFLLSFAFLFWGVAVLKADQYLLNLSVLVGNGLILFGSLFLLDLQSVTGKKGRIMAIVLLIIFMALFFVLRIIYYPPSPTVENGILLFNTALPVFALLGIVFIGVWLPGCIKMAGMLATTLQDKRLTFLFGSVYAMTIVAALIFMAARTIPVVVASFVGIVLCFVMLIASNIIVGKMLQQKGDN